MDLRPVTINDAVAALVGKTLKLEGFFPEFKAEHLTKLFARSGLFAYPPGYHLVEQGDTGRDVFIIVSGTISITKTFGDAGATLATLKAGDLFGEIALVRDGVRMASAITEADAQVFRLAYEDMGYLLKNNPELADHLKSVAYNRLAA